MRLLSRDQAVAAVRRDALPGCLMCSFRDLSAQIIRSSPRMFSFVPRYAQRIGHVMVVLREHVTHFSVVDPEAWLEACAEAQRLAARLEEEHSPARCYVASLGTGELGVPMSSPHLHLHVLPILDPSAKPSEVLTWRDGVYERDDRDLALEVSELARR